MKARSRQDQLTGRQRELIDEMYDHPGLDIREAAERIKVGRLRLMRWMSDPLFRTRLDETLSIQEISHGRPPVTPTPTAMSHPKPASTGPADPKPAAPADPPLPPDQPRAPAFYEMSDEQFNEMMRQLNE